MHAKICGVKDVKTLKFLISHKYPPKFIGFICNYPKSHRNLGMKDLISLTKIKKRKSNFVAVLVAPKMEFLSKISKLKFDFFQLYNVSPKKTLQIKKKFKKKIISAIQINRSTDIYNYKKYLDIADIILFDSKGYEKSVGFDHTFLKEVPRSIKGMLAGNIKYYQYLDKLVT